MSQMINSLGTLAQHIAAFPWPVDFFSADDLPGVLDRIHLVGWERRRRSLKWRGPRSWDGTAC